MLYADLMGLPKVVAQMKQFATNPNDDQAFLAAGAFAGEIG